MRCVSQHTFRVEPDAKRPIQQVHAVDACGGHDRHARLGKLGGGVHNPPRTVQGHGAQLAEAAQKGGNSILINCRGEVQENNMPRRLRRPGVLVLL